MQLVFRRERDTTPMAYVRRARLDAARREVLHADPTRTTVAAIAHRWGFANPGRFAHLYREEFGAHPGEDLRR